MQNTLSINAERTKDNGIPAMNTKVHTARMLKRDTATHLFRLPHAKVRNRYNIPK